MYVILLDAMAPRPSTLGTRGWMRDSLDLIPRRYKGHRFVKIFKAVLQDGYPFCKSLSVRVTLK